MQREKKIVVLSHCILNANSKVEGLSQYGGILRDYIDMLADKAIGIIQLPCPEMILYGIKRWGHVKDQFHTPFFRQQSRIMLEPIVQQLRNYVDFGYEIVGVIGIDGSPSCGVNFTCSGDFGGEISDITDMDKVRDSLRDVNEMGVFMEEFKRLLEDEKLDIRFLAIDEGDVYSSLDEIAQIT
ncbi:MAG: CD3072 family TudS-related putative desulfidase [Tissierellaceae bacterium]